MMMSRRGFLQLLVAAPIAAVAAPAAARAYHVRFGQAIRDWRYMVGGLRGGGKTLAMDLATGRDRAALVAMARAKNDVAYFVLEVLQLPVDDWQLQILERKMRHYRGS